MRRRNPSGPINEQQYASFVHRAKRVDTAGRLDRYPDLHPTHVDERFPYFDRAADNHLMWHEKEVEGAYSKDVPFPPQMICIGQALEIIYLSDKWENHAKFYSYVHDFDSHPEVYADASRAEGVGRPRSTARLLGISSVDDDAQLATPILARVAQFSFRTVEGHPHVFQFDFPPLMLCSPDKLALIVLSDQLGPIVVKGGRMEVTRRGIVK